MTEPNQRQSAMAATREAVLEAARRCFATAGYEGASLRAIAIAAGYSTGAIFHAFRDKAELYQAVYGHPPLTPEQGRAFLAAALERDVDAAARLAEAILREASMARPTAPAQAEPAQAA